MRRRCLYSAVGGRNALVFTAPVLLIILYVAKRNCCFRRAERNVQGFTVDVDKTTKEVQHNEERMSSP